MSTVVKLSGYPETVCQEIQAIIDLGNNVLQLTKSYTGPYYIVEYEASGPVGDFLLLETGDFLLLETGDKILLE